MERFVNPYPNWNYCSNHNSNAQIEPVWRRYIPLEFRRDIPMPGIGGVKAQPETHEDCYAENFSKYREREKSEDEYDGTSDDDYGRRSSCSLSDETSSMSETELSVAEDECNDCEEEPENGTAKTPTGQQSTASHGGRESDMLTCEAIEREMYAENSAADDTLTDLTSDSFNLSLMDSCFVESERSGTPEISALDISGVDLSYDQQDSSEQGNNQSSPEAPANPETVDIIQHIAAVNGILKDNKTGADKVEGAERDTVYKESVTKEVVTDIRNEPMTYQNVNIGVYTLPNCNFQSDTSLQNTQWFSPLPSGGPQSLQTHNSYQAQYCFQEIPQQYWGPPHHTYSCSSQNYTNDPFLNQEYQTTAVGFPQAYQSHSQVESYNTEGLLTAEQYYAGQQTPLDPVIPGPAMAQATGCIDTTVNAVTDVVNAEFENFQYPSLYVSEAGLMTVVLNYDVCVEMTVDKTVRVVSHQRGLVIATNNRGSSNYLYHPHAKLCHEGTTTEVELSDERRVKMSTEHILVAKGDKCYRFDYKDIQSAKPDFRDISQDNSVNLLLGSTSSGPSLISKCTELAKKAKYFYNQDGSFRIRINDICITQSNRGDVTVLCGPKFLKMAPLSCYLRIQTHFIDMAVYQNAKMFVRRGTHSLDSNPTNLRVDNGNLEAEFADADDIAVVRLPRRTPLKALSRRQKQNGGVGKSRRPNIASRRNR